MAKDLPKISDAEWEVMKIVWDSSPLTSSQIIEELKPNTKWNPKTIHTLINRLVKKGALGVDKETTIFNYYPLVSECECKKEETKSFLNKVYDGSINLLISNFIKEENLTHGEIDELKRLLDKGKDK